MQGEQLRLTALVTSKEQLFAVTEFAGRHPFCLDTVYLDAQLWFPAAGAQSFCPSSGKGGIASGKQSVCRTPGWNEPDEMPAAVSDCVFALRSGGVSCFLACPPVMRSGDRERFLSLWKNGNEGFPALADGFLIQTLDQLSLLQNLYRDRPGSGRVFAAEDCLYTMNTEAREFLDKEGVRRFTLPAELNYHELLALSEREDFCSRELIVYGYQPLMQSAQCLRRNTEGCTGKTEFFTLKDRRGVHFPVLNRCNVCCNTIYNSVPLKLFDCRNEIFKLSPGFVRLAFSVETWEETRKVLSEYVLWLDADEDTSELPAQDTGGVQESGACGRIRGQNAFASAQDAGQKRGPGGADLAAPYGEKSGSGSQSFAGTRGHFRRGVE